jgi:ATP-binding cassette subfamily E protein 1
MESIAIINEKKCRPDKCNYECKRVCPVESQGKECVVIFDIEEAGKTKKKASILESSCIACGICVSKCPFGAIDIVNIPSEIASMLIHRFGRNGFRLYKLPSIKQGKILGILGKNGQGKSVILQILTRRLKPNFGELEPASGAAAGNAHPDLIKRSKGKPWQRFINDISKVDSIAIKPQAIEKIPFKGTAGQYLEKQMDSEWCQEIIKYLQINLDMQVETASGGELQKLICAKTLAKDCDFTVFDELSNFLDIKQRLKIAALINKFKSDSKYIMIIEHDLALLDYISDQVSICFGTPGIFGIISNPNSTPEAINMYFSGYIPAENMRFRTSEYSMKEVSVEYSKEEIQADRFIPYIETIIEYPGYQLNITKGKINLNSSITLILGENGVGKTTFAKYVASYFGLAVSMKPQYLDVSMFDSKLTVKEHIQNLPALKSASREIFISDVIVPMDIKAIEHNLIRKLSGGELQRLFIVSCLGQDTPIYILDEPSACLDIEQRVNIVKVIKRFCLHQQKSIFVIEHDMMMSVSLAQDIASQIILIDSVVNEGQRFNSVSEPMDFSIGINKFLKSLDITIRMDSSHARHTRPRINKLGSLKDREQKLSGKFFD